VVITVDVTAALDPIDIKSTIVNMTGVDSSRVAVKIVSTADGGQVIIAIAGGGSVDSSTVATTVIIGANDTSTPLGRTLKASGATVIGTPTVRAFSSSQAKSKQVNIPIIAGVIGGLIGAFLLAVLGWTLLKQKKKPTLQSVEL
jgi:hypothetical protein